jgi:gliding motility-associated-like protein
MAHQPGTSVVIDGMGSTVLGAGEFIEFNDQTIAHCISASAPFHVVQLMQGIACSGNGDPSLIEVRPVADWQNEFSFQSTTLPGITQQYLKITVPAAGVAQCSVDGETIPPNLFTPFPACPGWYYINYEVNAGYHVVQCMSGISAMCYAVGSSGSAVSVSYAFSPISTTVMQPPPVDDSFCSGNALSINIPVGYTPVEWFLLPDTVNSISTATVLDLSTPIQPGLYMANTIDDTNGCLREFRYSVAAPGNVNISISPPQINACTFQQFDVQASAIPFSGALIYEWTPALGLNNPGISNPQITASETTVYQVNVSTPDGCLSGSAPLPVIVSEGSIAGLDILEEDVIICSGESATLNLMAEECVWEDNFDPSISWGYWSSVSGGEDNNACGVISGGALYFNSYPPREAITQPMTIGGQGYVHFTIKIANGVAPCDDAEPGDNVQLSFSVNNGSWQIFQTLYEYAYPEFTEVVVPIPLLAQSGSVRFKWGQVGMFTQGEDNWVLENAYVTRTMAPAALLWTPATGINLSDPTNPVVTPVSNTTYEVSYTDASSGCEYSDEVYVEVGGNYSLIASDDTLLCGGNGVQLSVASDNGTPLQYSWSPSAGLSSNNSSDTYCTPSATTTYTITAIAEDGCTQEESITIEVGPEIMVQLSATDSVICEGESVTLQAMSNFTDPLNCLWAGMGTASGVDLLSQSVMPSNNSAYVIRVEDLVSGCGGSDTISIQVTPEFFITVSPGFIVNCAIPGTAIAASSTATVPVSWSVNNPNSSAIELLTTEEPILAVIAETDDGCTAEASVSLIVSQFETDLGPDNSFCEDELYILQTGWPSTFDFLWNNGGTTPSIVVQSTGEYSVTVTSADGCQSSDTIFIEKLEYPQIALPDDTIFCTGGSVRLIGGPFGYNYEWSTGESSRVIDVDVTGVYSVVVSNGGCESSDTVVVGVRPNPVRVLPTEEEFCFGLGIPFQLDAGNVGSTYLWEDGSDSRVRNIQVAGNYSVTITTSDSCQAMHQIEVIENCPNTLFAPNTFTPDNDGINDVWRIYGQNIIDYRLQIFSRYGTIIFESDDVNDVWTGAGPGGEYYVDGGVYSYLIRYKYVGENGYVAGEEFVRGYVRVAR